jgi:hypothetical protein
LHLHHEVNPSTHLEQTETLLRIINHNKTLNFCFPRHYTASKFYHELPLLLLLYYTIHIQFTHTTPQQCPTPKSLPQPRPAPLPPPLLPRLPARLHPGTAAAPCPFPLAAPPRKARSATRKIASSAVSASSTIASSFRRSSVRCVGTTGARTASRIRG